MNSVSWRGFHFCAPVPDLARRLRRTTIDVALWLALPVLRLVLRHGSPPGGASRLGERGKQAELL